MDSVISNPAPLGAGFFFRGELTSSPYDSLGNELWNWATTDLARNDAGGGNTESIEGSVSAVLYQGTSATGLGLPNRTFADISHSCVINWTDGVNHGTTHPNGIDYVIWCTQLSLTADDISKLSARDISGDSYASGPAQPSGFNSATFRSNWHGRLLGIQ